MQVFLLQWLGRYSLHLREHKVDDHCPLTHSDIVPEARLLLFVRGRDR
jgi:hypothetical protein